ncbi:MAG: S16 family serine protease, partial [Thermodesulfobacteriota bacterium]|nr:S16 family serine protease [Thermodesulfobacteriota bacterium]
MGKTFLLFDNGNYYCVNCSLFPPRPESPRPADAYIVSESEGDFTIAAKNASHAAYTSLKLRGVKILPRTAGIELLERTNAKANIAGESGGLCFAIAFAKALLKSDMPDIAATGIINADGTIKKIKGIKTKLETAAQLVNNNGIVFYPKENRYNIPDELSWIFMQKQIKCHAVSHIDEVFDILLTPLKQKTSFIKISVALIIALIIAGISGYYFSRVKEASKNISS